MIVPAQVQQNFENFFLIIDTNLKSWKQSTKQLDHPENIRETYLTEWSGQSLKNRQKK